MKPFYLTLPSQGAINNTTSSYTVDLPYEIDLFGEWEVGVVEILYPTSWYNIYERNNSVQICNREEGRNLPECWDGKNVNYTEYHIEPGYYKDSEVLIKQINKFVSDFCQEKDLEYFYMDDEGYVSYMPTSALIIKIHPEVTDILGYEDFYFTDDNKRGELRPNHMLQNLYVYTDIIEPQVVGNIRADLLCIIPANERTLKAAHFAPKHIHYLPLVRNNFSRIQIHIRDVAGEPIAFASGHSVVKLHFRPVDH